MALLLAAGCGPSKPVAHADPLTVAAAANLTDAFGELGKQFTAATGIGVVFSFGSTAQLARQAEEGAPFDVFAAADREHVDALAAKEVVLPESNAVYARGRVALWVPQNKAVRELKDVAGPQVRAIAIASPNAAPYGAAAIEALKTAGLWTQVEKRVVYATNINMAKQFAATGNADAAITAYSLVLHEPGTIVKLDHSIEQSLGILKASAHPESARRFREFVLGPVGQAVLRDFGYEKP